MSTKRDLRAQSDWLAARNVSLNDQLREALTCVEQLQQEVRDLELEVNDLKADRDAWKDSRERNVAIARLACDRAVKLENQIERLEHLLETRAEHLQARDELITRLSGRLADAVARP